MNKPCIFRHMIAWILFDFPALFCKHSQIIQQDISENYDNVEHSHSLNI